MGIIHHSVFPIWFEVARTQWCKSKGLGYEEIEKRGYSLVVTKLEVRYKREVRFGDEVVIFLKISQISSRKIVFEYKVQVQNRTVATGITEHFWYKDGKIVRTPNFCAYLFEQ